MILEKLASYVEYVFNSNIFGRLMLEIMWNQNISRDSLFTSAIYVVPSRIQNKRCMHVRPCTTEASNLINVYVF